MSARRTFRRLAVIGAGNMGSGIAQKMAGEGFAVVLVDLDETRVAAGLANVERTLAEGVERRIFRPEQAEAIRARLHGSADWNDLADVDLVVEAVFEDLAVKRQVFEHLDRVCREDALLATNTSSLSVSELAAQTRRPQRVLGLHYFYHPAKNRLVEVVPGEKTDPAALAAAWTLQEQLGKTPIASADAPGFVVNRFFVPWINEAVRVLDEGLADAATIEAAARGSFGVAMGPFQLMNVTGIPIALHAATTLGRALGPFYAPAPGLARQVDLGQPWSFAGEPDPSRFPAVSERLLAVTYYVASALVDERVGTLEDTDIGARVGLRWPRGPFELINRQGVARAAELVGSLCRSWELAIPRVLADAAAAGRPFRFRLVRSDTRDGIAWLTINRPDAMNALNEDLVTQLHEAVRAAVADPAVRGIVIGGAGKAFIAGADIRFFVRNMDSGDLDRIVRFTEAGHALLHDLASSPKPVVARLHGLALGGGLELALACHAILASPRAAMAFPETGIGIYPGLGGTQRTPRRVGPGLARWLIFTGETLDAATAQAIGLIDRVVPHEELDDAIREWIRGAAAQRSADEREPAPRSVPAELAGVERLFQSHRAEDIRAGRAQVGADERAGRAARKVAAKAPLALGVAETLIDAAGDVPLERGLRMELEHLVEIFKSADAYEGLSSLGRRKPEFHGR